MMQVLWMANFKYLYSAVSTEIYRILNLFTIELNFTFALDIF